MFYIYVSRGYDFSSPKYLIVKYNDRYFKRGSHTEWSEMEEKEIDSLLSGRDENYYGIEEREFKKILSSWGGSQNSYKTLSQEVIYDEEALDYLHLEDE